MAYRQLLQYREDLENPPLLVVCDFDIFEVHTNYTNTMKQVYKFSLADLIPNQPTATCKLAPLEVLRALFTDPERLKPKPRSRMRENSGKSPVTQVQNRGFWGCRRKSAETPVFMRVGRRFCPQLGPHLDFESKNGSFRGANSIVLARQGGDLSVIQDCS